MKSLLFGVFLMLSGSVLFPMDSQAGRKQTLTKLLDAAFEGDLQTVRKLTNGDTINSRIKGGDTVLHIAIQGDCNFACIKYLLEQGAKVNAQDNVGLAPLHWLMLKKTDESTVQLLLDYGAELSIVDENNISPLHFLSQSRHVPTLQLLMKNGAERWINYKNKEGNTPLHVALMYYNSVPPLPKTAIEVNIEESKEQHQEFIRLLLAHGADTRIKNEEGESPYDMAKKNPFLKNRIFDPHIEKLKKIGSSNKERTKKKTVRAKGAKQRMKHTKCKPPLQPNTPNNKKSEQLPKNRKVNQVAHRGPDMSDQILIVCLRAMEAKGTHEH